MEFEPYIVYVKPNSDSYIIAINSSSFLTDTTDWVKIDSGYGDRYHHAQGNYFEKPIMTDGDAYRYKLVDGKPVECTAEEIKVQEEANEVIPTPSAEERFATLEEENAALREETAMLTECVLELSSIIYA